MQVCVTIDVECREERYAKSLLLPAAGYDLRVFGRFANQRRELGIAFIMGELEAAGIKGTFFVDPFGARSFGLDELSTVCRAIRERGHDLQLHAHPRQTEAFWITRMRKPPSDMMADYSVEEQSDILRDGMDLLERCGVPRSEILAFRAGHFAANNDTWRAMRKNGLLISSSYNPCYFRHGCRIAWPRLEPSLFQTGRGVWELPVSNFKEPGSAFRHFQITAVSLPEMKHLLLQAHQLGLGQVTFVAHPFEFFHLDSVERRHGRLNLVNTRRFQGICRFLHDHSDLFNVVTVAELAKTLPSAPLQSKGCFPKGTLVLKALRLADQLYKRIETCFPIDLRLPLIGRWDHRQPWS